MNYLELINAFQVKNCSITRIVRYSDLLGSFCCFRFSDYIWNSTHMAYEQINFKDRASSETPNQANIDDCIYSSYYWIANRYF
jgi:hypothetical protein